MHFMVLIYNDPDLLAAMPEAEFGATMRECLSHADALKESGKLIESQMLEGVEQAKSIRVRGGRKSVHDGPFTETKEILGGFNLIEAADMAEALRIAESFPWARSGCVEVRPVRSIAGVREKVGAPGAD